MEGPLRRSALQQVSGRRRTVAGETYAQRSDSSAAHRRVPQITCAGAVQTTRGASRQAPRSSPRFWYLRPPRTHPQKIALIVRNADSDIQNRKCHFIQRSFGLSVAPSLTRRRCAISSRLGFAPGPERLPNTVLTVHAPYQNILYVTVNLPDIKPETLEYSLTSSKLSFKAKAGK